MPKTELLVICDSFSAQTIDEIVKKETGYNDLYGILSAPEMVKTLAAKFESPLQEEILFSIRLLKRILDFQKILMIGHFSYHDIMITEKIASMVNGNTFYKNNIDFLGFEVLENTINILKSQNKYEFELCPEIIFTCSDPRMVKIHLESGADKSNPLNAKNYLYSFLPGSTMLFSRAFGRNHLRTHFNRILVEKNINRVIIEHHSDCGAYKEHYNDKLINGLSLYKQSKDMEKFYKLARSFGYNVTGRYLELDDLENQVKENSFEIDKNGMVFIEEKNKFGYDFKNHKIIENIYA